MYLKLYDDNVTYRHRRYSCKVMLNDGRKINTQINYKFSSITSKYKSAQKYRKNGSDSLEQC
jgi:hypothetical protein